MKAANGTVHVQAKYIQANGLKMYYRECGSGAPLILLHSGTATSSQWDALMPVLGEYFHVLAPDCRGHGHTDNPQGMLTYMLMAEDILAFSQAVELDRPAVCGWSDGGHIALEMGIHYPEAIQALVVGSAGCHVPEESILEVKEIGFEAPGKVNFGKLEQNMPEAVEYWRQAHSSVYGEQHWKTLMEQLAGLWLSTLDYTEEDIQRIEAPTLLIAGDRDHTFSVEDVVEMYGLLEHGELAILPNADHALRETHTDLYGQLVVDFVMRHTPELVTYP